MAAERNFRNAGRPLVGVILFFSSWAALASSAEIIDLIGQGDVKQAPANNWLRASLHQQLDGGAFVRTGDLSQMAVLLRDQTQLRLNQNSVLQIKELAASGTPTRLELSAGRAWMQAKSRPAATGGNQAPALEIRTPNAVAAIRGTDWDIEVAPTGNVTLTVLSGEVELYNDFGRVMVAANQQAYVEAGKAPVKRLLTNARERVQWVTAYRPKPRRWITPGNPALNDAIAAIEREDFTAATGLLKGNDGDSSLLRADLLLFQGETAPAIAVLEAAWRKDADNPRLPALLARAHLLADQSAQARTVLETALARHPKDTELWLAKAELARIAGDAGQTRAALDAALALDAKQADAWFGLGRLAAEREDVTPARERLNRALELNPGGAGYRGELATLETFADRLAEGDAAFAQALNEQPADYVALTGQGVLRLKQGRTEEALETLLKAGLLEPRYARAAIYTGIAYYQLGRHDRASETLQKAAELDPRDPLPHMMLSRIAADRMEFGAAIAAAQRAAELMPYLKSLNQLANDQKGTANVGAALAQFGLEEWAQAYAHNAYTPHWAGSHLFLADRYLGEFNKNSELYQGFLSDPTAFGASNRHSTLITRPGVYADLGTFTERWRYDTTRSLYAKVNGMFTEQRPMAYYLDAIENDYAPGPTDIDGKLRAQTLGIGFRPAHEVGLFLFGNQVSFDSTQRMNTQQFAGGGSSAMKVERADVGGHYEISPTSHLWLKIGRGRSHNEMVQDGYSAQFGTVGTAESAFITDTDDWHLRHMMDVGDLWQFSWGVERGEQTDANVQGGAALTLSSFDLSQFLHVEANRVESQDIHFTNRFRLNDGFSLHADISRQNLESRYGRASTTTLISFGLPGQPLSSTTFTTLEREFSEWNPRFGMTWQPAKGQTLRLTSQHWRRPAMASTLSTVDTAGIPVDDRLVSLGGRMKRARLQYEWEVKSLAFLQGWLDHQRIDNLAAPDGSLVSTFSVPALKRLQNKAISLNDAFDELEDVPAFGGGRVETLGLAGNAVLRPNVSLGLRYQYRQSENTGTAYMGRQIPWLPRHLANASLNWLPAPHWQIAAKTTWRDRRYSDEANTQLLAAGWSFGLHSYLETADKRAYLEVWLDNLHRNKASSKNPSMVGARLGYRF